MPMFARRGSKSLPEEEFLAHLALATRLENVAVLLGAGASKGGGGGVMADVWKSCLANAKETVDWLVTQRFLPAGAESGDTIVDVESLLNQIDIAEVYLEQRGDNVVELRRHRAQVRRQVLKAALLDPELWSGKKSLADADMLADHMRLLTRLVANRQPGQNAPWVFTTNYDLAVEWAAERLGIHQINGFTGLHHRTFRPTVFDLGLRNVVARGEARFGTPCL